MSNKFDLMTTAEVSDLTCRPVPTLRYWRHIGQGPASFKLGNSVVYERAVVEAWIEEQKRATNSVPA